MSSSKEDIDTEEVQGMQEEKGGKDDRDLTI